MIVSIDDLRTQVNTGTATDETITAWLDAIEAIIRSYTNNNFQNRSIRITGLWDGTKILCDEQPFAIGDTVQIANAPHVNANLCSVVGIGEDYVELDCSSFYPHPVKTMVTKIEYPADVRQCAIDLYKWKTQMGDKVGIKSESISRHSVTYEDSGTLYMGYPVGILKGLMLYKKARC